jgi:predicted MFS family arabinose efflux permease
VPGVNWNMNSALTTEATPERAPGVVEALGNRATLVPTLYAVLAALPVFLVSSQSVVLQRELEFGRVQLGLAISACYAASALTAVPLGRLLQRAGASSGLRLAALLSMTALVVIGALATSWWHLVGALALCGAANASAQIASNLALASGVVASRQALAFGAKQAAVPFAGMLAGLSVPLVADVVGWRADMLAAAAVLAATLLFAPRLASGRSPQARREVRADRFLVALGVSGICAGAVGNALPAFTVDAATSVGLGHNGASLLLALGGAAAIVGRVGVGWIADRRGSPGLAELVAMTLAGAAAFALLAVGHGSRAIFVLATLIAFAMAWGWPGIIYFATVRAHPEAAAAASGFVLSWVYTGNVLGPAGVGAIAEGASYTAAWVVSAVVLVGAGVAAEVARRAMLAQPSCATHRRNGA